MTNALRYGLCEHEFRERYILRRVLCETYTNKNILDTLKYNTVIPEGGDYIHILKKRSYLKNFHKKVSDDNGFYDYKWRVGDTFTELFDEINDNQGMDIEYENYSIIPFRDDILEHITPKDILILKIGFPDHFVIGIIKRKGNTLYFETVDPSGIVYTGRNLVFDSTHRKFQFAFRKWVSQNSIYNVYFKRPMVNVCFQYNNDCNCQTWVYYYIHIVYIDKYTKTDNGKAWLQKIKNLEDITNKFEVGVTLNILLNEFIQCMSTDDIDTVFVLPQHKKLFF